MTRALIPTLFSLVLLAGCPTRPSGGSPSGRSMGGSGSSVPTLQIVSPASNTPTNGAVTITVAFEGDTAPPVVTILGDGAVLGTIDGPAPYGGILDTKSLAEGPHVIVAEANVDGEPVRSAPITILVDRTAPTVASTTPATGAVNVVLRAPIEVTFSEPILASTFTSSAVSLQIGDGVVATTATLSADGTKATIAIDDLTAFALPAKLTVTLAATITDSAGNALTGPVAPWSWNVPDWIRYAPLSSYHPPVLAVGPDFQPVLAYTQCLANSGAGCVYPLAVAANDGQSWNTLGQLNNVFGPGSLDLDNQGHPIVAGSSSDAATGGATLVVAAWNGTAWDDSIPALPIDDSFALPSPAVRLDPSGRPVVAWIQSLSSTTSDVAVGRWTGSQWDRSFGLLGLPGVTSQILILDGNGNPIVGWNRSSFLSGFSAWNGTAWSSPRSNIFTNEPFVALDQALEPIMLDQETATVVDRYANGTWSQEIAASVPVGSYSQNPHLAVTPDHEPVIAWIDTSGTAKVGLARWTGAQWVARAGLFNANYGVMAEAPAVVVDARGSAWVAWRENLTVNVWMSNY